MLAENIQKIKETIQLACSSAGRSINDVTMIAVTKSVENQTAKELAALGIVNMAENRVDKLLEKKKHLVVFLQLNGI